MRRGSKTNRLLDRWLGVPLLNLLASAKPPRGLPAKITRIGVLCSPALGDTLLFSAVLKDLRTHFDPQPRSANLRPDIVHLCMKENVAAAELIAGADRRILIDLVHPLQGIRRLRAQRFDLLLDFSPWQRITALHTLLSAARFTAGFRSPRQFRGRAYDLAIHHRPDLHELENFRALLSALGIAPSAEPAVVVPNLSPDAWQECWQASLSVGSPGPLNGTPQIIVLHPWPAGAQSWMREWPRDRWLELARRLSAECPSSLFAITGGPQDQLRVRPMLAEFERMGLRCAGFCGSDGLRSVVALLRRARLAVSVNTGIMHLAAIVGTPTLGLNGPTANHRWGPLGRCARGIGPPDGSGGYLHFGFEYPRKPEDVMGKISVDQVLKAALELMPCGSVL